MLLKLCVSLIVVIHFASFSAIAKEYKGYKVLRLFPRTEDEVQNLRILQKNYGKVLDFWKEPRGIGHPVDIMVGPEFLQTLESKITHVKDREVMIEEVQELIDAQVHPRVRPQPVQDFNYSAYHTYKEVVDWVRDVGLPRPDLVSVFSIGKSFEGRDILGLKIGNQNAGNAEKLNFYVEGGIHAREWIAPATVMILVKELLGRYDTDLNVKKMVDQIDWYIVPILNVDGYEYTWTDVRLWRKTRSNYNATSGKKDCIGSDANRNWDIDFGNKGADPDPCSDTYPGPHAFSEIEVQNVVNLISSRQFHFFMDLHSYSQLFMSPYSYTKALPKDYDTQINLSKSAVSALEAVYGTNYTYGTIANIIYEASGSTADFAYVNCSIVYSYGLELRDTGKYGFLLPEDQIMPTGLETFEAFKASALYIMEKIKQENYVKKENYCKAN